MDQENTERARILRAHKAAIRRAFVLAVQEIAPGEWTEEDDAALDAATGWLYAIARDRGKNDKRLKTTLQTLMKESVGGTKEPV